MAAIVQQAQGSVTTNYGIGTTAISTGTASALIAFVGWNYGTSGTYVATPAVSVADSAGKSGSRRAALPSRRMSGARYGRLSRRSLSAGCQSA